MCESNLNECIDSHDSQIWLTLGIVHEIKIDELLQLNVIGLHAIHDIREERTAILITSEGFSLRIKC